MSFITSFFCSLASAANAPIVLRGRFGAEDLIMDDQIAVIEMPLVLLGLLATLLITGAIFVSLEVRMEARAHKA
ncbi:MAG: hypothetical protein L3J02_04790 [Henriciella sp.]|nr:hypothetical protein [Henriciella sp.]